MLARDSFVVKLCNRNGLVVKQGASNLWPLTLKEGVTAFHEAAGYSRGHAIPEMGEDKTPQASLRCQASDLTC